MALFKAVFLWLDKNIEKNVILISYMTMAGIIFVEVIRRFLFSVQAAWSTTIPIYLFLIVTWMGASYNAKMRTHLSFSEVRARLPYKAQFGCLLLDAVCWIFFGVIVVFFTVEQVKIAYDNFSIVYGTDSVLQWWFYMATPVSWSLLIFRVLQNLWRDWQTYCRGEAFTIQSSILNE